MNNEGLGQEIQLRNLAANTPLSLCNWKNGMVSERPPYPLQPRPRDHWSLLGMLIFYFIVVIGRYALGWSLEDAPLRVAETSRARMHHHLEGLSLL